jgi:cytochrome oxidase Cu insertion factor (SCO1/SenC/PrrC family)/uncharacterized membrane protein YozB (DUF420 family)
MTVGRPILALAVLAGALAGPAMARQADDDFGPVPPFRLTERSGRKVTKNDLLGHVWVASFVFTRCTGPCPQVTATMQRLQEEMAAVPDVRLVTFTVDPTYDDAVKLSEYADHFGADKERWLFLTGPHRAIYDLMEKGLRLPRPVPTAGQSGPQVDHSTRLVVVDAQGHVRGYFDGMREAEMPNATEEFEANLKRLRRLVNHLAYRPPAFLPQDLPRFNAALNAVCALLLLVGYAAVRSGRWRVHAAMMLAALAVSVLFLASYLYYHLIIKGGRPTSFQDEAIGAPDWVRQVYLAVLFSHTLLAAVVAPVAPLVAYLGWHGRLAGHVRLARWLLPAWLYVSVSGVLVYWMLYRLPEWPLSVALGLTLLGVAVYWVRMVWRPYPAMKPRVQ